MANSRIFLLLFVIAVVYFIVFRFVYLCCCGSKAHLPFVVVCKALNRKKCTGASWPCLRKFSLPLACCCPTILGLLWELVCWQRSTIPSLDNFWTIGRQPTLEPPDLRDYLPLLFLLLPKPPFSPLLFQSQSFGGGGLMTHDVSG